VEHPVTEMVTGIDLVQWQIRLARGERLTVSPRDAVTPSGHAIECRIYAEDPDEGFLPSPGRITALRSPAGPGIRDDSGAEAGGEVPIFYDALISKLIAWGGDRAEAIARMQRALREYEVRGIRTTIGFFRWMLAQREFVTADFHTGYLDELLQQRRGTPFVAVDLSLLEVAAVAAAIHATSQRSLANPAGVEARSGLPTAWTRQARLEGVRG
jgi:acetyl-CoA carboxylase biotin carboxylase subunit